MIGQFIIIFMIIMKLIITFLLINYHIIIEDLYFSKIIHLIRIFFLGLLPKLLYFIYNFLFLCWIIIKYFPLYIFILIFILIVKLIILFLLINYHIIIEDPHFSKLIHLICRFYMALHPDLLYCFDNFL